MRAEQKAKLLLQEYGVTAYDPGQHTGPCKEAYTVVHCYGNYQTVESARLSYTLLLIHCYVPLDGMQTQALSDLTDCVKRVMRGMKRQAKPTGREEPDMVESEFRALSRTIEYQILKSNC